MIQNIESNWVLSVVLSRDTPKDWNISWMDIVKKKNRYFHPAGWNGWPKNPVNYIGFRYDGKLQSIHHIENYEIFTNPHDHIPEIPNYNWEPCFIYRLGPSIELPKQIRNGRIFPSARIWCMIDTLFTCETIHDAMKLSKKRVEDNSNSDSILTI
jgi:hypothetical protein